MEKKPAQSGSITDLNKISAGSSFVGDMTSNGDFRIDGKLKGSVKTSGRVVVGVDGIIDGDLECSDAEIEGIVNGNLVIGDTLAVKSTGSINGKVAIKRLSIEMGAVFNVECQMK